MSSSRSPLVFTPEWVEQKRRRYESAPAFSRPRFYKFWTESAYQDRRDRVETWVELLGSNAQTQVIPRLRDEDQFRQTFNEIGIGAALRAPERHIIYEPEIEGLTPDWLVHHPEYRFLVEVVSSNPPVPCEKAVNGWNAFQARLHSLPHAAFVSFRVISDGSHGGIAAPPDSGRQKQMVREIGKWLAAGRSEGEELELPEITVTYLMAKQSGGSVASGWSGYSFFIDGEPMRDAVQEKCRKYKGIVETEKIPFVVLVVSDFWTGRGVEELRDSVLGSDRFPDVPGLFPQYPHLSAVAHAYWVDDHFAFVVIPNPKAAYPLDQRAISQG